MTWFECSSRTLWYPEAKLMKFTLAILARFITCMLDTPSILFKRRLHPLLNELSPRGFVVWTKHSFAYLVPRSSNVLRDLSREKNVLMKIRTMNTVIFSFSAKTCGNPGSPVNGKRDSYIFTFGSTVHFDCNRGYKLVGDKYMICQANQRWSGRLPTCERKYIDHDLTLRY